MNLNLYNQYLTAYWNFNELSGIREDSVSNIPLYESLSTISYANGISKYSPYFDSSSYLYIYDTYFLGPNDDPSGFFISCWVMLEKNTKNCVILNKETYFTLSTDSSSKWKATISGIELSGSSWAVANVDQWYHVCFGASNNILFFSINSVDGLNTKTSTYTTLASAPGNFTVGESFTGRVDELAIWAETNMTSIDEFLQIENEIYQDGIGLFYNSYKKLWELKVDINDVITFDPLINTPDEYRPNSLANIITYNFTSQYELIGNNGSNSKSTTEGFNSSSLSLGTLAPGETSKTIVLRLSAPDSITIKNIKIGLINSGCISFTNKTFGIETRNYYDKYIIPETYFQGISDETSTSAYNVEILNSTRTNSYYVYINVKIPLDFTFKGGTIRLKWFFDFA